MHRPDALSLLTTGKWGIARWNEIRGSRTNSVDLTGIDLRGTDMIGVDLGYANLKRADLSDANLHHAELRDADLTGAIITGAILGRADLGLAKLIDADLRGVDLNGARLVGAKLDGANLSGSHVLSADLHAATARGANLSQVDFRGARLLDCDFTTATLTGALMWGTARDGWTIDRIECDYIYEGKDGRERLPPDRDFAPGEFERLYKSLPTIEYVFKHGIHPLDLVDMDVAVQRVREDNPELDLRIKFLDVQGFLPRMLFTIQGKEYAELASELLRVEYETRIACVEEQRDRYREDLMKLASQPRTTNLLVADNIAGRDVNLTSIENHFHDLQRQVQADTNIPDKVKETTLGLIGDALKDVAKQKLTEAAVIAGEIATTLGPLAAKFTALAALRSLLGGG